MEKAQRPPGRSTRAASATAAALKFERRAEEFEVKRFAGLTGFQSAREVAKMQQRHEAGGAEGGGERRVDPRAAHAPERDVQPAAAELGELVPEDEEVEQQLRPAQRRRALGWGAAPCGEPRLGEPLMREPLMREPLLRAPLVRGPRMRAPRLRRA